MAGTAIKVYWYITGLKEFFEVTNNSNLAGPIERAFVSVAFILKIWVKDPFLIICELLTDNWTEKSVNRTVKPVNWVFRFGYSSGFERT